MNTELMKHLYATYEKCQGCGEETIENGAVVVVDGTFIRACHSCGHRTVIVTDKSNIIFNME